MNRIIPFIWFNGNAEEAMQYYIATFPDSKIVHIDRYTADMGIPDEQKLKGKVLTGVFNLYDQRFMCLDGGPEFKITEAISLLVQFDTQSELDHVWDRLVDGGKPLQCGWVTDKFGVTWQIVPKALNDMLSDQSATTEQKQALMKSMMQMVKLDIDRLRSAFDDAR